MYTHRFTVFTPTYNRAYILGHLYESLTNQTFSDFEWLIVDDGSSDSTEALVTSWQKSNSKFPIRYIKQNNGGKHRAINTGLRNADGEIFFTVDSDDTLTPDAMQKMDQWFHQVEDCKDIVSIAANKGTSSTFTPNPIFKRAYIDQSFGAMSSYQENGQYVLSGERAIAIYTDIHKKFLYPEYPNERFMTEAVVYNRIGASGLKTRFYNDIIWIYEYKEDGLTRAGSEIFLNNPHGYGLWLREKARFEGAGLSLRLKLYYTFTCDLSGRISSKEIAQCIGAPCLLISAINTAHKLIHKIRK